MSISHLEIEDFLVFKGKFSVDFCAGINILTGGNGTGKTTLLRCLEWWIKGGRNLSAWLEYQKNPNGSPPHYVGIDQYFVGQGWLSLEIQGDAVSSTYIPEKDILEHAKGLLTFIESKQTGFIDIYRNVLIKARDVPTRKQTDIQKYIGDKISRIIGGHVEREPGEGQFYTVRTDGLRIPFANEASGFKKLGFLGLLVTCGQLEPGSVLLWDEPENSLNPELIPDLADILIGLSRNGVQVFIATHCELANEFSISRKANDSMAFFSLYKGNDDTIRVNTDERFISPERCSRT